MPKGNSTLADRWIGRRFGRLVVVDVLPERKALTKCDCGSTRIVFRMNLNHGRTSSCGCFRSEIRTVHGQARDNYKSPEYKTWQSMIDRCSNKSNNGYYLYGGRGITVCEKWLSFANFFADMGPRPADRSLDRIDNNKGYFPGNCRWATTKEQLENRRIRKDALFMSYGGVVRRINEWSVITGINRKTLRTRLSRGWTVEEAITTPLGKNPKEMK